MKKVIIIFVLWLVIVNIFALVAANRYYLLQDTAYGWQNPDNYQHLHTFNPLPLISTWDGGWYLDVAANGYSYNGPDQPANIVFFPLYPFLISIFSILLRNAQISAWLVSILSLALALGYFYKLTKEFHPKIPSLLPVVLMLIFPTAFFFNVIYTESLFLFLSIASFYYTLKKNYKLAGLFGFFASLTRVTGVLLFIPIIWEYLKDHQFKLKSVIDKKILPLFLIPIGTISFFLFHYFKFGDFFLFLKVENWWGRAFKYNPDHFNLFSHPSLINLAFDIAFVVFALVITFLVYKKLRTSYALYMLATVVMAISTGTLMSIGRYILILFPIYLLGASIKNEYVKYAWIFTSLLLFSMYITLYINGYWAG